MFAMTLFAIFAVAVLAVGTFYEWVSCALCIMLILWLLFKLKSAKSVTFKFNLTSVACALVAICYALSAFWAVDKGMAVIGFFKFLPIPLFLLCLYFEPQTEDVIKRALPFLSAVIVIITSVLMQIPALKSYFSVAGRLAGTFEYPNTFALLLLVAELLTFDLNTNKYLKAALFAVLIFGILYTGSRTVLILAVAANLVMIISKIKFSKKTAIISIIAFLAAVGLAVALALAGISPFNRILTINFGASTFVGRLLYFKDAFPIILKHPFGLGYLGYFYTQTTFQTGVYSVKFIHNDIMQLCLDIGWIPAVMLVAAVFKSLFSKGTSLQNRVILSVMFLHILFDFDLQFIAVFMLFIIFLKRDDGREIAIKNRDMGFNSAMAVLCAVSLYFSVALALYSFGKTKAADNMYKFNTDNKIKMLISMNRAEGFKQIADRIIDQNPYVYIAYAEKARAAYKEGNFTELIKYKNQVFEYAPLVYDEYEEYCYMLINGVTLYNDAGDSKSAEICKKQLIATKEKFEDNFSKVSELGMKINDKPETKFPDDIEDYIKKLNEE